MATAIDTLELELAPATAESNQTYEQKVAAALDDIAANDPNVKALQARCATEVRRGIVEWQSWRRIMESKDLSDSGKVSQSDAWAEQYAGQLVACLRAGRKDIAGVRSYVLPSVPTFAPSTAVEAAIINGSMADLDSLDPVTAAHVAREAIARKDRSWCARAHMKLSGIVAWKKAFAEAPDILDVLDELQATLASPDVIRSDAAAQWTEAADIDLRYLARELWNANGNLDAMLIVSGALATLFPDKRYPKAA